MRLGRSRVVVATYNHAPFVAQSLRSVAEQETERSFEIIISEDYSTDYCRIVTTSPITSPAHDFCCHRVTFDPTSIARGIRSANGRYLCVLDGDDYWTSPTKLTDRRLGSTRIPLVGVLPQRVRGGRGRATRRSGSPGEPSYRTAGDEIWMGNPYATCAGMLRVSALRSLGTDNHRLLPDHDGRSTSFAPNTATSHSTNRGRVPAPRRQRVLLAAHAERNSR